MAKMKKFNKTLAIGLVSALIASLFVFVPSTSASLCSELSESTGGFFSCGSEEATSFTQFEGGLQPPSSEGYDPTLTQETNLRDYIVNVVNFILGFLGLIAVVMVIYGGFMYVIAGGEEEKTTKGKKSVMYAMIGIVIILISFALVNTVIKGVGKGTDVGIEGGDTLAGSAEELTGDQTAAIQRLFYVAATKVEMSAKNLATAYQSYVSVDDAIADLRNVPLADTKEQLKTFLSGMKRSLRSIITASGELSRMAEEAKYIEDEVDFWINATDIQLDDATSDTSNLADMFGQGAEGREGAKEFWTFWQNESFDDFQSEMIGLTAGLEEANMLDFQDAVSDIIYELENLKIDLENSGFVDTSGTDFELFYNDAMNALDELLYGEPYNILIVDALTALSDLHTVVQNIKFVAAIITTDTDEGNAPLIVNFDALKSVRPDFTSVNESDIEWDFGDGTTASSKFAVSHVYKKTGSYVVKLSIKGDSASNIASGTAYKEITIKPPASQINLKTNIGDRDLGYLSYYKDGFLVVDKNRLNLTLTEARDIGVTFDASESRGGYQSEQSQEAGETYIQTIEWSFGDGGDRIYGEMVAEDVQTHYYGEEGTYPVVVEVTDSRGISDRKVFEVVVDSPAARIDVQPGTQVYINEDVTFDAGQSSSDGGQVTGYDWDIQNTSLHYSADESLDSFTKSFESPGVYNVNLKITDNLGNSADDSTTLIVRSEAPQAQFEYGVPDSSKPHVYFFDGTKSVDPDGNIQEGSYSYNWKIGAIDTDYDFYDPETGKVDPDGASKPRTYIKFYKTGDYNVSLQVNDLNEPDNPGVPQEQLVRVSSILDVAFGQIETSAAILDENSEAVINFSGYTENGIAYEWEFGDGSDPISGDLVSGVIEMSHTYTQAGSYDVRLTVFDKEDNENSIVRRVTIGEADNPIAVISASVDGVEIYDFSEALKVNRKSVIAFSASQSINVDGTGRRLNYQWDFGDTKRSTDRDATHTYSDLSPVDPGYYIVTLKVLDKNDLTKTSTTTVFVDVEGELPTLQAFTAVPQQNDLTTPVRVKLDAIGAKDPDGQIVKYLWWYYNEKDPLMALGHTITQSPQAYVTIGTRGVEGEEANYKFALQMTDQENFTIEAKDILAENTLPSITVVNGPNDIPVAQFTVDRTSVMVGETVNFTSSSYDPDGKIVKYIWDFEGDGFGNNKETSLSTIAHTYEEAHRDGVNVRLKVIDNNFAESTSMPVKVYVDSDAEGPVAEFKSTQGDGLTMMFTDESVADEANGSLITGYKWDFDISSSDSDGDGVADNDIDSTKANPEFTYPESGIYRAKLTIEDNFGSTSEVIHFVNVQSDEDAIVEETVPLNASFETIPEPSIDDGMIHLSGEFDEVSFDFSGSTGNIDKYVFDNNVYFDSNENGRKADDIDYQTQVPGVYTTTFNPESERIKVRLTVYDEEGNMDIKEVRIVFDDNLDDLQTNLLAGINQKQIPAIVVSLVLFAIVTLSLYLHSLHLEEVTIRNVSEKMASREKDKK